MFRPGRCHGPKYTREMDENVIDSSSVCASGAFHVAADGTWYHEGVPIRREALVRLFAGALCRDPSGAYWLRSPGETIPVTVEDAPFRVVDVSCEGEGRSATIILITDLGWRVPLDAAHPLHLVTRQDGPRPYLRLDGGLSALITRPVWYRLCERAVAADKTDPVPGPAGVWSAGCFFPLEGVAPDPARDFERKVGPP